MREYKDHEISQMAQALAKGEILAFPTDTVYGVGTVYGDPNALQRLKNIKHRPETKPIPMMASRLEVFESIVKINPIARKLAQNLLPGALTLVVELQPETDRTYTNGKETAAIRIPNAPVLLNVMDQLDVPLMVTSANVSGAPAALTKQEAMDMLPGLDGILDGQCHEMQASTIVDCTGDELVILRQGPLSKADLLAALEQ